MIDHTAEKVFPARLDQLEPVQEFVNGVLEQYGCTPRMLFQLDVAIEEIFVNIAHYAYSYMPNGEGDAIIRCRVGGEPLGVSIQFIDHGQPFNPLEKEDADITLSAEERDIGGLGILMVKKSMDAVDYKYEDGSNILTIQKYIQVK